MFQLFENHVKMRLYYIHVKMLLYSWENAFQLFENHVKMRLYSCEKSHAMKNVSNSAIIKQRLEAVTPLPAMYYRLLRALFRGWGMHVASGGSAPSSTGICSKTG